MPDGTVTDLKRSCCKESPSERPREEVVSRRLFRTSCCEEAVSQRLLREAASRRLIRGGCFEKAASDCFEEITSKKLFREVCLKEVANAVSKRLRLRRGLESGRGSPKGGRVL